MTSHYVCLWVLLLAHYVGTVSLWGQLLTPGDALAPPGVKLHNGIAQRAPVASHMPAYPHDYRILLDLADPCHQPPFLLVVICSSVNNARQRDAIRHTWASSLPVDVKVVFILGNTDHKEELKKNITKESLTYKDIIQEDFLDTYQNLSLKTVGLLKWISTKCEKVKYVLKTDDDIFINVPLLLDDLRHTVHSRFIMGNIIAGAQPVQDETSKYYTPKSVYSKPTYPKYMSGSAYVISGDLVGDLYQAAVQTAPFWIEDIYITGLVAEKIDMQHIFNGKFGYKKRTLHPCLFKHVITGHYVTPAEMIKLWQKITSGSYSCERSRLSHGNMDGT